MKHYTKRAVTAVLVSAAMLTASMCPAGSISLLNAERSMVAYAADYNWSGYLKKSADWFGSSEATALCDTIVKYQLADGGWRKAMDDTSQSGSWAKSTTDNDATTSQIRILARTYMATNNSKYYDACIKGIDLLLNGQYDNGGWPQVFGDAGTYHAHITFNDGAMIRVLEIMWEMENKSGDFTFIDDARSAKAATAIDKAVECILDMQIEQNGVKTAWCQQHDEFTLAPAPARAYELPSISASESVGIVNFLKKVAGNDNRIIRAINAAVTWFTDSAIYGIEVQNTGDDRIVVAVDGAGPLWARFYDLDTNQPMFVDRDGSIHSQLSELSQERRAGYAWYGNWGKNLIAAGLLPEVSAEVDINGSLIQQIHVTDGDNGSDWKIAQNLAVGSTVFGDRDFTYTAVPDALLGAEYVQTACDSKNVTGSLGTLTAGEDTTLYVAYDTRLGSAPAWLSDWEDTGMTLSTSNDVTMAVVAKTVAAGEQITLGDNTKGTGVIGYTVLAKSQPIITTTTTETTTTTTTVPVVTLRGDVNCDGFVKVGDVILLNRVLAEDIAAEVSAQGMLNAECDDVQGVDGNDAVAILKMLANLE